MRHNGIYAHNMNADRKDNKLNRYAHNPVRNFFFMKCLTMNRNFHKSKPSFHVYCG